MDTGSLVQPGRQLEFFEKVEELAGTLEIPERPSMTAGYADIYCGLWITPQGERVEVAVKELRTPIPKDRRTGEKALKTKVDRRLKREIFIWSQIKHPNLHGLLGYCLKPKPRLISAWCRHGNMTDYLQANPDLTRCDKLRLIYQAACGLEHLHSRVPPICHADIKPENVLINDCPGAALSDFGLSRVVQDLEARSGFTTSETIKGTMRYMAGELFAGQQPNLASDVYAFGGFILTVMSGKPPFDGLPPHVILCRVVQDKPPIPEHHPDLPSYDSLWKLMPRCWDKDPTARPTMREVMELLEQIIHEESSRPVPRMEVDGNVDPRLAGGDQGRVGGTSVRRPGRRIGTEEWWNTFRDYSRAQNTTYRIASFDNGTNTRPAWVSSIEINGQRFIGAPKLSKAESKSSAAELVLRGLERVR